MSDRCYLDLAARLALRGMGDVEPNPMVGAVIVKDGRIIGMGHHQRFGGPHAEREALADCRACGNDPRGSTVYVTLEPCRHTGKTLPCTDALIEAGVARVVAARPDPNPVSGGGQVVLQTAGISCVFSLESELATRVSDPFVRRVTTGMPWVMAKWAQTPDGRLVTNPDEPRWISGEAARRRVHRLRARVDAIMTGIGTVLADDPLLTARGVARVRRVAKRVVIDGRLETPTDSAMVRTARDVPLIVACAAGATRLFSTRSEALRAAGVEIVEFAAEGERLDLRAVLRLLSEAKAVTTVMLEAGPRLLEAMFAAELVDKAVVHVAGTDVLGTEAAMRSIPAYADRHRLPLVHSRRVGADLELTFAKSSGTIAARGN
ncbi:MAG: bifunctional diaminohydroxyphosphoribosylaminopyrimidine deaminase/5-amino-6-(5-phosphoribosylamino)uracil reductase RibD [Phycisphaerales bacterium]